MAASAQFGLRPSGFRSDRMKNIMPTGFVTLELGFTCGACNKELKVVADVRADFEHSFDCPGCNQNGRIVCSKSPEHNYWLDIDLFGNFENNSYKIQRGSILWNAIAEGPGGLEKSIQFNTNGHGQYIMPNQTYFSHFGIMPSSDNPTPYCRTLCLILDHIA